MTKIRDFAKECVGELQKVVWPGRVEVLSSVKVVLVSTVVVAAFLGILDALFVACIGWIF